MRRLQTFLSLERRVVMSAGQGTRYPMKAQSLIGSDNDRKCARMHGNFHMPIGDAANTSDALDSTGSMTSGNTLGV